MTDSLYSRLLAPRIAEALGDTPVVLINGPRQSGKTTLVRSFIDARRRYLTLDDPTTLASARADPTALVRSLDAAVIDEVQRAPELLLAVKRSVDQDRRPGRFLLTGSADVMALPGVADSLAGRMESLTLLPLAGCELHDADGSWLPSIFAGRVPRIDAKFGHASIGDALTEAVLRGGYPEAVRRSTPRRRNAWLTQYTEALIHRDVRDIAVVDKLDHLPRLLRALAHMSGELCNFAALGGQVGLDAKTAGRYLTILERMFLLRRVEPWSVNRLSRIVKTPKIQFIDSGLLAALIGLTSADAAQDRRRFGHVLESYVYGELLKGAGWADDGYAVYTYRDKDKVEVDFVIENAAGKIIGVEVKAAAAVSAADFTGLRRLAALAGRNFRGGVLLYDGVETLPMGADCWAVPLATLWTT
jgi:predicted AAA+ superfamily ATPase